ncbi:MAG TPA: flagellar transcriptional regulator FlhD [Nitrosomonas sp.]|jgi:flagellar transcriptional activator FlhD|nr:flagellar transcriptional regulator FlhD [Nitrosomonas sp.]MBP6354167.1 flagellar transcriptional regulator FlhD [Nitrosomonas sp.]MBP9870385.1 flagellar transcriptional regulator FlhD [Nitrosomonas sp.]MDO8334671.1 flagellar transcriptional regulator FlhD [Nitrosomonas sp.]HQV88346.1 flagellar transcriptional regulator FlhD [Nitrosomonas sp.]
MESNQILDEIRDINLGYLLLAKQLLQEDKVTAMYRLGINQDLAEILDKLTSAQMIKMAASNMLLCRFRFDDRLIAEMLSNDSRDQAVTKSHAAILLAGKPAEAVV